MKKTTTLFRLTLLLLLASPAIKAQNINLSNSPYWDGECYLAVNPKNPNHLVSAWMYFSLSNLKNAIATRTSFDGGKTWSPLQILPHVNSVFTSADPSICFGKDSCVYLAYIDLTGLHSNDSGYDMVARSVNGGLVWKTPVKAIGWNAQPNLPVDRPWVGADAGNGPYSGRVYLTSQNAYFAAQPHHPWFTYSSDSGLTWSPIKQLDDSVPAGNITDATAFLTVSASGTIYGAYFSYYTPYSPYVRLILVKSYNGGGAFTTHAAINYTVADAIPAADSLLKDGRCISSNPIDTNNLIIIGTTNRFGEPDVASYNSLDGGMTWNGPTRMSNDQSGAYDTCHDQTWGGFSANGTYAAIWRDRRNTGTGDSVSFQIYGTVSTNKGNSFSPNFLISDTTSPYINLVRGNDFLSCAVSDSNVYALWSDMRTGKENTFFNAMPLSKIPMGIASVSDNVNVSIKAYPNPFHNQTNVVVSSSIPLQNCKLEVFSIDGRKEGELSIPANGTFTLNFNYLSAGTYIWSLVENDHAVANGKWVIQ